MNFIFNEPIFTEMILPFLLVFVLVFAILQKSKILGDGKSQIDALISLAIAFILIGAETPRNMIVNLMPFLAVGLSVLLVFFILYGFVEGDLSAGKIPDWLKIGVGILSGLFVIIVVIHVSGFWQTIKEWFDEASIHFSRD